MSFGFFGIQTDALPHGWNVLIFVHASAGPLSRVARMVVDWWFGWHAATPVGGNAAWNVMAGRTGVEPAMPRSLLSVPDR